MKRFWREAMVQEGADGCRVELDRRPLRTPLKRPFVLPSPALAERVAAEWRAASDDFEPRLMVTTRLASTVLDRMPRLRLAAIDELMGYLRTDLICYRAGRPATLRQLQDDAWDPVLAWLSTRFAAPLRVTRDVTPIEQPAASLARLSHHMAALDDWRLVGLHALAQPLGSAALALAVADRFLTPPAAVAASLVDEQFEMAQWGWDSEKDHRQKVIGREVDDAAGFLRALEPPV